MSGSVNITLPLQIIVVSRINFDYNQYYENPIFIKIECGNFKLLHYITGILHIVVNGNVYHLGTFDKYLVQVDNQKFYVHNFNNLTITTVDNLNILLSNNVNYEYNDKINNISKLIIN